MTNLIRSRAFCFLVLAFSSSFLGLQDASGQEQDRNENQRKLAESLETWNQIQEQTGGNYVYSVIWTSHEAQVAGETSIVVRNGAIVERRYRMFQLLQEKPPWEWTESGDSLGSHEEAAPLKTIDELYAEATEIVARDLSRNERLSLYFHWDGLLHICTIHDRRIADDDNGSGVNISSIMWEE